MSAHSSSSKGSNSRGSKKQKGSSSDSPKIRLPGNVVINPDEIKIIDTLGSGAFGKVFVGKIAEQRVAIKTPFLHPNKSLAKGEEKAWWNTQIAKYKAELDLMRGLHNPHTCQVMGAVQEFDGDTPQLKIVMELLDGDLEDIVLGKECKDANDRKAMFTKWQALQERKAKADPNYKRPRHPLIWRYKSEYSPPLAVRLDWARQALHGVHWLHRMKDHRGKNRPVIHRDLKMANLLYKGDPRSALGDLVIKVGDFGLSQLRPEGAEDGRDKGVGTLFYLAPEVLKRQRFPSSDIYTLGLMMWEFIMRRDIYANLDPRSLKNKVLAGGMREEIPSRAELLSMAGYNASSGWGKSAAWPDKLSELISQMWAQDHTARPTAEECARRLSPIIDEISIPDPVARDFWVKHYDGKFRFVEPECDKIVDTFLTDIGTDVDNAAKYGPFLKAIFFESTGGSHPHNYIRMSHFGKMVAAFGPVSNTQEKNLNGFFSNIENCLKHPYFHGVLATRGAEKRLKAQQEPFDGRFLIRLSNSLVGSFALSRIQENAEGKLALHHSVINRDPMSGTFSFAKQPETSYKSLEELVTKNAQDLHLTHPAGTGYPYGYLFQKIEPHDDPFQTIGYDDPKAL